MTNNLLFHGLTGVQKSEMESLNLNFSYRDMSVSQCQPPAEGCLGNDHPGLTVNSQQIAAILGEAQRSEFNCPLHIYFLHIYFQLSLSQTQSHSWVKLLFRLFC